MPRMKINPSPSFSIDLTVESTLTRQDLENLITADVDISDECF